MIETAHDDTLDVLALVDALEVRLRADEEAVERPLVLKALDVLDRVRVDLAQRAGELVVEALDHAEHAAADAHDLVVALLGRALDHLVVVGHVLLDDVRGLGVEEVEEAVNFLARRRPQVERHVRVRGLVVVEHGIGQRERDADPRVRRRRERQQLLEDARLLDPVRRLLAARLEDGDERLEHALGRQVERLAAASDRLKVGVVAALARLGARIALLRRSRSGRRRRRHRRFPSALVRLGVLSVSDSTA